MTRREKDIAARAIEEYKVALLDLIDRDGDFEAIDGAVEMAMDSLESQHLDEPWLEHVEDEGA